jgi:hypothetical protein
MAERFRMIDQMQKTLDLGANGIVVAQYIAGTCAIVAGAVRAALAASDLVWPVLVALGFLVGFLLGRVSRMTQPPIPQTTTAVTPTPPDSKVKGEQRKPRSVKRKKGEGK